MSTSWLNDERLLDLLVTRATEGLAAAESGELATLLEGYPQIDAGELDAAVAAITVAAISTHEPLPLGVAQRVLASAAAESNTASTAQVLALPMRRSPRFRERAGWWAAAACLVLAVLGWWPRLMNGNAAPGAGMTAALSPEEARRALLSSGHAIQAAWSPQPKDAPDALLGDVVFDPLTQRGYLRFRGIPANDPRLEQYQLWIADASRKPPEPVDGGVFDVNKPQETATGDVIIPFEAKLPVGKPAAFVVTVEKPGGVVVSKQERVLALAKVASST